MDEEKVLTPEEEEEADIITLTDEDGKEYKLEVIASAELKGTEYLALVPIDEDDGSDELDVVFMRVGTDEEGEFYDIVEDDDELEAVGKLFRRILGEQFDIRG